MKNVVWIILKVIWLLLVLTPIIGLFATLNSEESTLFAVGMGATVTLIIAVCSIRDTWRVLKKQLKKDAETADKNF